MTQRGGFQDRKYAVVNIKMTEVFRDVGPDDTAFQLNLCMPVQSSTEVVPQVDVGAVGAVRAVGAVVVLSPKPLKLTQLGTQGISTWRVEGIAS